MSYNYDIGAGSRDIDPDFEELQMDCVAAYILENIPGAFDQFHPTLERAICVAYSEWNSLYKKDDPVSFLRANSNMKWLECTITQKKDENGGYEAAPLIEGVMTDHEKKIEVRADSVKLTGLPESVIDSIKPGTALATIITTETHDERIIACIERDEDEVIINLEPADLIPWYEDTAESEEE